MPAPNYSAADFTGALQALLPRGRVWPRDRDATQTKAISGLTPTYERQTARANQLLVDGFPATTHELLPEWESALGLPDPCAGIAPTLQLRRAQVVTRFAGSGGQSIPYIVAYAASLGFAITVTQFSPARVGVLRAGDPINGQAWAFAWRVNAPLQTAYDFRVGISTAGEALTTVANTVLECELREISPAHSTPFFAYT